MTQERKMPRQPMTQEQVDDSWDGLDDDHPLLDNDVAGTEHPSNLPEDAPANAPDALGIDTAWMDRVRQDGKIDEAPVKERRDPTEHQFLTDEEQRRERDAPGKQPSVQEGREALARGREAQKDSNDGLVSEVVVRSITITAKLSGGNGSGAFKALEMMTTADVGENVDASIARRDLYMVLNKELHAAFDHMQYPGGTAHIDAGKDGGQSGQSQPDNAPEAKQGPTDHGFCTEHNEKYFKTAKMQSPGHVIKDVNGADILDENGKARWCRP